PRPSRPPPRSRRGRRRRKPRRDRATPGRRSPRSPAPARASRPERLVDELIGADGVLLHLGLAERSIVDARRQGVDEPPLEDTSAHGGDRILAVRVEVEAEPLAVLAVARSPELEGQLERFHECERA